MFCAGRGGNNPILRRGGGLGEAPVEQPWGKYNSLTV